MGFSKNHKKSIDFVRHALSINDPNMTREMYKSGATLYMEPDRTGYTEPQHLADELLSLYADRAAYIVWCFLFERGADLEHCASLAQGYFNAYDYIAAFDYRKSVLTTITENHHVE